MQQEPMVQAEETRRRIHARTMTALAGRTGGSVTRNFVLDVELGTSFSLFSSFTFSTSSWFDFSLAYSYSGSFCSNSHLIYILRGCDTDPLLIRADMSNTPS